jgi:signal transduction histidine kinase
MQAADFFAVTGAATLALLALLHGMVWHAQHQRWAALFALCMAMGALYFAFDPWLRPVGDRVNPAGTILGALLLLTMQAALIDYVGLPQRLARGLLLATIVTGVLLMGARLAGWLPRVGGFISYAAYFTLFAGLAGWGLRREPGRGHGLVLLALLAYPATVVLMLLGQVRPDMVRYVIIVPTVMLGMAVLTTGQMRERAAAQAELQRRRDVEAELLRVNDSLEQRVAERTAELRNMVAGLESFNRSVSHDLRGPLGGMAQAMQLAQRALDQGQPDEVRHILALVGAQADSSADLVNSLLTLARVGSGDLRPERVDAGTVVAESLAQLRAQHGDSAVVTDPAQAVTVQALPPVTADPSLLRQVFVNLLGNALKFTRDAAAPQVEVGATQQQGQTVLYVRDNGVGFARESAARLFEPFQRLHGAHFPGSGVGLSIVKRIIDRHGGRLWAESTPGEGSTFFFTLGPDPAAPT